MLLLLCVRVKVINCAVPSSHYFFFFYISIRPKPQATQCNWTQQARHFEPVSKRRLDSERQHRFLFFPLLFSLLSLASFSFSFFFISLFEHPHSLTHSTLTVTFTTFIPTSPLYLLTHSHRQLDRILYSSPQQQLTPRQQPNKTLIIILAGHYAS